MKIIHVCLASHYTEGMTYQDNQLSDQNALDGHEVIVISDNYKYKSHQLVKIEEEIKILPSGVKLIRLAYDNILGETISSKIRKVSKLKSILYSEKPDVILFHGVAGYELLTVGKYKKDYPKTKLYVDSHEDFHNSGTFWLSYFFQYKVFNNFIVKKIKTYVDKFLYISSESKHFLKKSYGLQDSELEFYPLGGNIVMPDLKEKYKKEIRDLLKLKDDTLLILHSGKFDAQKKTQKLLSTFSKIKDNKINLCLIGSIPDDQKTTIKNLVATDSRVSFLGWKSGEEFIKYLCAADLYFQPGTQSATMQNAICCGAPVALYPYDSHKPYLKGNGYWIESESDYFFVFTDVLKNPSKLIDMSKNSYQIAHDILDYKKLAARLYQQ